MLEQEGNDGIREFGRGNEYSICSSVGVGLYPMAMELAIHQV